MNSLLPRKLVNKPTQKLTVCATKRFSVETSAKMIKKLEYSAVNASTPTKPYLASFGILFILYTTTIIHAKIDKYKAPSGYRVNRELEP